ncbi:MAG: glycosyltransferase family 4 protein [Sphingomonas sp.]|jgi:glycosyltransferase involved in cell wall biosynthesis|uniref:glycosyltransferase family 4 protein n=1 Tax=Sphingomonas sp. TaxID=28214 RepID=UPI003568EAD2
MPESLSILLVGYAHGEGGVTTHTHWLAHGLTQRGHKVRVLSPVPPRDLPESPWPDRGYAVDHYGGAKDMLRGFAALGKDRFDVAVVAGTGWKAMGGVLANRRIKRRIFFEVMSGDAMGKVDPRRLVHAGFDAIVSLATAVQDKVCSEFHWRGKRTIIQALPEPLELLATIPDRGVVAPAAGKIRAVYFGRIVPHKGVGFLVEQWAALSPYLQSVDVYGTGDERAVLEPRIAELGLSDVIRFHGRYPDGQAYADLLQQYDLLLLPTVGLEGGPLVLLEAMACGTPFVANGMGGVPDFDNQDCRVSKQISGFVAEVADIAGAMAAGQIDGSRLQRHYHDNFSYEVLVGKWESYFRFLVNGK